VDDRSAFAPPIMRRPLGLCRQMSQTTTASSSSSTPTGLIIGNCPVRLWGMNPAERLRRSLRRNGVARMAARVEDVSRDTGIVMLRSDYVFDEALVRDLIARPGVIVLDPATGEPTAAHTSAVDAPAIAELLSVSRIAPPELADRFALLAPAQLSSSYNKALRKKEAPYLLRLTAESLPQVEKRMFAASYKGVTDIVTKYVWPWPAQHVTKLCALLGLSPNMVTSAGAVLMLAALWLFYQGDYALGLVAAWIMTFLDTVDGKLARVTLTSSQWGNLFDHGIDLVHPPFWWWAWVLGLEKIGMSMPGGVGLAVAIIWLGYVSQRLQEGYFIRRHKIDMHTWRPFDSFFRLITARRNPNMIILTGFLLLGRPDLGMAATIVWIVIGFGVHMAQIIQAERAARGGPLVSHLSA
jgi:phosphatidylglycerophosphate synthase